MTIILRVEYLCYFMYDIKYCDYWSRRETRHSWIKTMVVVYQPKLYCNMWRPGTMTRTYMTLLCDFRRVFSLKTPRNHNPTWSRGERLCGRTSPLSEPETCQDRLFLWWKRRVVSESGTLWWHFRQGRNGCKKREIFRTK